MTQIATHPSSERQYLYQVHGVVLRSEIALHDAVPIRRIEKRDCYDAIIRRGDVLSAPEKTGAVQVQAGEVFHIHSRYGSLQVGRGYVEVRPVTDVSYSELLSYFAVYAVAILLHLRGELTLHASAVEIDGQVVAFLGEKQMGKSTTASCFVKRGHRLLSDDMIGCRLQEDGKLPAVAPGFPWLKVFGNVLRDAPDQYARSEEWMVPGSRKRLVPLSPDEASTRFPLAHLYILAFHDGQDVIMKPASEKQAFLFLIQQAFIQRLTKKPIDSRGKIFSDVATLARRVPLSVVGRPQSLESLPEVYDSVCNDVKGQAG